jgi:hypothetical protein
LRPGAQATLRKSSDASGDRIIKISNAISVACKEIYRWSASLARWSKRQIGGMSSQRAVVASTKLSSYSKQWRTSRSRSRKLPQPTVPRPASDQAFGSSSRGHPTPITSCVPSRARVTYPVCSRSRTIIYAAWRLSSARSAMSPRRGVWGLRADEEHREVVNQQ